MAINELETGFFNLNEFIGYDIQAVRKYFKEKNWKIIDCKSDYSWIFFNEEIDKTIIFKTELNESNFESVSDVYHKDQIQFYLD